MSLGSSGGTGKAGRDGTRWVNFAQNLVLGSENTSSVLYNIHAYFVIYITKYFLFLTKSGQHIG
jgi:hypothetical protein